jgi:hypothetical protein
MASIVIARGDRLLAFRGFGIDLARRPGWPVSRSSATPCGLSAVPRNNPSCPTSWLAVAPFPPRPAATVAASFRRPCGTTEPSDSSCSFVISSLPPRRLPLVAETRRSPRVRTQSFVPTPPPIRLPDQRISGFAALGRLAPGQTPLSAVRSRSVPYCAYGFLRTLLAETHLPLGWRVPSARVPRRTSFRPTSSGHLLLCAHAGHTKAPLAPLGGCAGLDRPPPFAMVLLCADGGSSRLWKEQGGPPRRVPFPCSGRFRRRNSARLAIGTTPMPGRSSVRLHRSLKRCHHRHRGCPTCSLLRMRAPTPRTRAGAVGVGKSALYCW